MTISSFVIRNKLGIHVRPAGVIAKAMTQFPDVQFEMNVGNGFIPCMGIMSLMTFELVYGKMGTLQAKGPNDGDACDTIVALLEGEFECDKVQELQEEPPRKFGQTIVREAFTPKAPDIKNWLP